MRMITAPALGVLALVLSAATASAAVPTKIAPRENCAIPSGNAAALFELIGNSNTQPSQLQSFIQSKSISATTVNANCEPPAFYALRKGRRDLFNEIQNSSFRIGLTTNARINFENLYPSYTNYALVDYLWLYADMVTILENLGPNPAQFDANYSAPVLAATGNTREVLEFLISAHPVFRTYTNDNWAELLSSACRTPDVRVAPYVLSQGGGSFFFISTFSSPMHVCAQTGRWDMIPEFVKAGGDPKRMFGKERFSPLAWALKGDSVDTVQALLNAGVSPSVKVSDVVQSGWVTEEYYPINFAIRSGASAPIIKALYAARGTFAAYATRTTKGATNYITAPAMAILKNTDVARILATLDALSSAGVSMNASGSSSVGALEAAIVFADKMENAVIEKVLRLGGRPNDRRTGSTETLFGEYFRVSAKKISPSLVQLFLTTGKANANTVVYRSSYGNTPAHIYALLVNGNFEVARMLLQAGANVEALEPYTSYTLLGIGARSCSHETIDLALSFNANKKMKMGNSNWKPKKIARKNGCSKEIRKKLR